MTLRPEIPLDVTPRTDGTVNVTSTVRIVVEHNLTVEQAMADRLVDAVTGRVKTDAERALIDALLGKVKVKWAR